jgi:threonine dehydrogenase-like Zn-dependent dehydrogenase
VVDTTGAPILIEESLQCTEKRGKLVLIGVPPLGYEFKFDVVEHINVGETYPLQFIRKIAYLFSF